MHLIDLDHNATTPPLPEALDAMRGAPPGNPASAHAAGRKARQALEDARESIAAHLGAHPDEVVFTSGATEANNLALHVPGTAVPGLLLSSPLEHPCVLEPLKQLAARGFHVETLPVDVRGIVSSVPVSPDAKLVAVMLANHETGAIQPVRDVALSLPPGVPFHCDAAQAVGKMPVNFKDLGVTSLSASGHKFGGPKGVGVLIVKRGTPFAPLMFGGHQQKGRRPGTEAVPLAAGMAAALDHCVKNMAANRASLEALRSRLWEKLRERTAPVVLNGPAIGSAAALPTTLNVSFPGCRADVLLMALDLAGVMCSTGSACSSGSLQPSPVLRAMGVPDDVLRSAIRFSFGPATPLSDIDEAAERIGDVVNRVRQK